MEVIKVNRGVKSRIAKELKTNERMVREALGGSTRSPLHVAIRMRANQINEEFFKSVQKQFENQ